MVNMPAAFAWVWPRCIAHRGAGSFAPENTLAAMRLAYASGYRAVEFDVMLTADAVPVLMHDTELGRTVAGRGAVAELTWSQLRERDAGAWFGEAYRGETVPSYVDVLRYCTTHGIWMNVEIKPAPGVERQTGEIVARLTQEQCGQMGLRAPLFSSFSPIALDAARVVAPSIARGLLVATPPENWREQLEALQCVALHCNHTRLSAAYCGEVKRAGYGLLAYTVNTVERAQQLAQWGVDAFCSDRPDLLAPLIA